MKSLKDFIDENFATFSNLGNSEVLEWTLHLFDIKEISYLKDNYRFDYKGICVYYVERTDEIWVENMNS